MWRRLWTIFALYINILCFILCVIYKIYFEEFVTDMFQVSSSLYKELVKSQCLIPYNS